MFAVFTLVHMSTNDSLTIEKARLIHATWPVAALALYSGAWLIYLIIQSQDIEFLDEWLILATTNVFGQLFFWRYFYRSKTEVPAARLLLSLSGFNGFLMGLIWALATWFFLPSMMLSAQVTYIFLLALMSIGSLFAAAPHYPTFFIFFLTIAAPLVVCIALGRTILHPYAAVGAGVFAIYISIVAYHFKNIFLNSLNLRFKNEVLVEQLTIQKEAAESANIGKSRFLAAASHDLRQPMHALTLYLGSLDSLDLPAKALPYLDNARNCANTLENMFDALLDISKFDAQVVRSDTSIFTLEDLFNNLRIEFEQEAAEKGVKFTFVDSSVAVETDFNLLGRMLRNLVSNAVRYTDDGSILVGCRRKKTHLIVNVYDTGTGIPLDQQSSVFEEFHQLQNPERDSAKGLGLGLAIVDRIANLLDITVTLQSKPDHGTWFSLAIPRTNEKIATADETSEPLEGIDSLAGKLVVVIDDEVEILKATRDLLTVWGCEVVTAENKSQAIERLTDSLRVPDALLCDYRLRGSENGLSVVAEIRDEFNSDIPSLLITGDTGPGKIREFEASKLNILHKPLQVEKLKTALTQLVYPS